MKTRGEAKLGIIADQSWEETESTSKQATELTLAEDKLSALTKEKQPQEDMSDLESVLRDTRDFCQENAESFKEIRDDIKKTNNRVEEAEQQIMTSEDRIQTIGNATLKLLDYNDSLQTD